MHSIMWTSGNSFKWTTFTLEGTGRGHLKEQGKSNLALTQACATNPTYSNNYSSGHKHFDMVPIRGDIEWMGAKFRPDIHNAQQSL